MADGGKSEEGMLKEKRACNPDDWPAIVFGVATLGDERAEKKVRKIGTKMRQKRTRRRRGGRISRNNRRFGDENEQNWTRKMVEFQRRIDDFRKWGRLVVRQEHC